MAGAAGGIDGGVAGAGNSGGNISDGGNKPDGIEVGDDGSSGAAVGVGEGLGCGWLVCDAMSREAAAGWPRLNATLSANNER